MAAAVAADTEEAAKYGIDFAQGMRHSSVVRLLDMTDW